MSNLPPFHARAPELLEDPYPSYQRYREEDPVHWGATMSPSLDGQWWIFRHDDVAALLANPRVGRDWRRIREIADPSPLPDGAAPIAAMLDRWMVQREGADHARLRGIANRAFTPRVIARLRPAVEEAARDWLARIPEGETFELVSRYARPFSVQIVAELLGIPREDRRRVGEWIRNFGPLFEGSRERGGIGRAAEAATELSAYFAAMMKERKGEPRDDLVSDLANDGCEDRFTEAEAVATCMLLIGAAHVTTVQFLSNSTNALLAATQTLDRLREEPARFESVVDELLRFDGPTHSAIRYVEEPVEVRGKRIEPGTIVGLMVGSAHRDPEAFADPDRIDIDRDARHHLGFGRGAHFCLGAALARLEGGIGLRALFERFPGLSATDERPKWSRAIGRGISKLVVAP